MPRRYRNSDRPSDYQPLVDLLAASDDDEVVLTFKEVAAILHPTWWRYKRNGHVVLWTAIGWQARADRDHLRVIFTRATEE